MKFSLTILRQADWIQRDFDELEDAYEYANARIKRFPDDIVMLTIIRTDTCKNCRLPIQEVPGAILHKWVHQKYITRVCFNTELTQAEPMEVG